jgi:Ni,Fe-hydrogenase I small subunit
MLINQSIILWKTQNMKRGIAHNQFMKTIKKIAAGLLAILLAPFGIHKFLGYTTEGIIWLAISLCTCGTVTAGAYRRNNLFDKVRPEFYQTYQG